MNSSEQLRVTTFTNSSPLGEWTHSECVPFHLANVVEKLWHFEGQMELLRERSFPRVYSEIILQLGPRFRDVHDTGQAGDEFPQSCYGGPTTAPTVIEAPNERCCVIGIHLHAVGAYRLFRASPQLVLNNTISLDDALGRDTQFLAEACHAATTVAKRFEIICSWIERRLRETDLAHAAVEWAANCMEQQRGAVSIAELQQSTSLSKAKFGALFREQIGLAPKHFARILRFRHALSLLQRGRPLSDAALRAGYYDQAHMYRDFGEFARMTPADFVADARYPNSLSLPEAGS